MPLRVAAMFPSDALKTAVNANPNPVKAFCWELALLNSGENSKYNPHRPTRPPSAVFLSIGRFKKIRPLTRLKKTIRENEI